jgi:quercetin dioxygenase-like cupin family protein
MPPEIKPIPKAAWEPLPQAGSVGVEHVVLMRQPQVIVLLKFSQHAAITEHHAPLAVDVICMEGSGMTSVNGEEVPIHAGETVHWPANINHRLWTEDTEMVTLMVEQYGRHSPAPESPG